MCNMQYVVVCLLLCCINGISQIITPLDSLQMAVSVNYQNCLSADVQEYKESNKSNFLYFIPAVGYDFINHTYVVSYNFNNVGQFIKAREAKGNKIKSIENRSAVSLDNALYSLQASYNYINNLIGKFQYEKLILGKEEELFSIYQLQYDNDQINHEDYLNHSINMMKKVASLNSKEAVILGKIQEFESKFNCKIAYSL